MPRCMHFSSFPGPVAKGASRSTGPTKILFKISWLQHPGTNKRLMKTPLAHRFRILAYPLLSLVGVDTASPCFFTTTTARHLFGRSRCHSMTGSVEVKKRGLDR